MKIATPVATMGIRGTTGVVQEQPDTPATITANAGGATYSFAVMPDFGTGITGMWDVFLTDANGNIVRDANGNPIVLATVSQSGYVTYLTPQGLGQPPLVSTEPVTNSQYAFEQDMLHQLFLTLNPTTLNGNNGSSTTPPPFELPNPIPQLFEDKSSPFTINVPGSGSSITVTIDDTIGSSGPLTVVIWIAGGNGPWSAGPSWLGGAPPTSPQEVEISEPGQGDDRRRRLAAGLVINAGAFLNIVSGTSFTIYDFIHGGGTVQLNSSGSDPTLFVHGTVTLVGGGTVEMLGPSGEDNILGAPGTGAVLVNIDYTIEGTGTIGGGDGNLTFENFGTVNANNGLLTVNTGNQVYNDGLMEATAGPLPATAGTLAIKDSVVNAGTVQADGVGSAVTLSGTTFDNLFSVVAKNGGGITFTNVIVTNEAISTTDPAGGTINAAGGTITFDGGSLANGNMLEATDGGTLQLESLTVTNSSAATASVDATSTVDLMAAAILGGTIENAGNVVVTDGASVLHGNSVTNSGTMTVEGGASLTLEGDTTLINQTGGTIMADGGTVSIELETDTNVNSGTIEAVNGGEVDFYINVQGGSNQGLIEAGAGGTVHFFQTHDGGGGGGGGAQGGNYGTMEATDGGVLIFDGGLDNFYLVEALNGGLVYLNDGIKNHAGTVEASGDGSQISINGESENAATIIAENDGVISLASVMLTNDANAMIEATSGGSISWITGGVDNFGTFDADGGTITFGGSIGITNEGTGIFEASDGGSITFGTSGIGSVTNAAGGLIEALSGGTITFDSTLNGAQNAGTIEAGTGGTVIIDGFEGGNGLFDGDGMGGIGTIEAIGTGAKVELSGATIIGGYLGSSGGGEFETVSGTSELINVILTGGVFTTDSGTILDLNGGSNGVAAYIDGTVTLEGTGTVEMDSSSPSILGGLSNGTLNNQTTIEGQGQIGSGDSPDPGLLTLINSGTIEALGGELVINTGTRNSATTTNSGTLEANGANAILLIDFTNMNNAGGTIAALNGADAISDTASVVELLDVAIVGGTLETSNYGTIETVTNEGGATVSSFDGVTNLGYVYVSDDTTLILRHTIDQTELSDSSTGTIALGLGGNATLEIDGTVALNGGAVQLNGGNDKIVALAPGAILNNASTISGAGQIGAGDGNLTLDNQSGGVVNANVKGATLTVDTGATVGNYGLLEATNCATLSIADSVYNYAGAFIEANGGTVSLTAGYTNYGTIEAIDCGTINITANDGDAPNFGMIEADHGGTINITTTGYNSNHGTIEAGAGGTINFTRLATISMPESGNLGTVEAVDGGTITFSGTGGTSGLMEASGWCSTITFNIDGASESNNGGTMEALCGGAIIVNGGTLNNDYNTTTDTAGTIEALRGGSVTVNGGTIFNSGGSIIEALSCGIVTFDDGATIHNSTGATIEALSGGTVNFDGVTVDNFGGIIAASGHDAVVNLFGATINGGTLETSDCGIIETPSGTSTLNGVTIADGSILETNDGTFIDLENTTTLNGTVTFEGGGTFVLDPGPASIVGGSGGGTLDIAAGATLTGSGDIGDAGSPGATSLTLNNAGTIDADGHGAEIDIDTGNTVGNCGLLEATNCATLSITDSVHNYAGAYIKADGGTVFLTGGVDNAGTIEADACGTINITIDNLTGSWNSGLVVADCGGTINISDAHDSITSTGTIEADGGTITITHDDVSILSYGTLEAIHGGMITVTSVDNRSGGGNAGTEDADGGTIISNGGLGNLSGGLVEAINRGTFDVNGGVSNASGGTIKAASGGTFDITVDNTGNATSGVSNLGTIEADRATLCINIDDSTNNNSGGISNSGTIEADHGTLDITFDITGNTNRGGIGNTGTIKSDCGTLNINIDVSGDNNSIGINNSGTMVADGGALNINVDVTGTDDGTGFTNSGTVKAIDGGTVTFSDGGVSNSATIEALCGSTVNFDAVTVNNYGGSITAIGEGAAVDLYNTTIYGGTLATDDETGGTSGLIEIISPVGDGSNTTVFNGVDSAVTVDAFVKVDPGAALEFSVRSTTTAPSTSMARYRPAQTS